MAHSDVAIPHADTTGPHTDSNSHSDTRIHSDVPKHHVDHVIVHKDFGGGGHTDKIGPGGHTDIKPQ